MSLIGVLWLNLRARWHEWRARPTLLERLNRDWGH